MAKKLLSEAQVRKFMGLANLDANLSSNFLSEMYGHKDDEKKMEEEKHDDEKKMQEKKHEDEMEEGLNLGDKHKGSKDKEPKGEDPHKKAREMDEGMGMYKMKRDDDEAMEEEMDDAAPEGGDMQGDADQPDVDLEEDEVDLIVKAAELLTQKFAGKVSAMDDGPADEPEMEMDAEMAMDDEPEMMEEESITQLSEDEIIQEVAKRVAERINKAARAKKK